VLLVPATVSTRSATWEGSVFSSTMRALASELDIPTSTTYCSCFTWFSSSANWFCSSALLGSSGTSWLSVVSISGLVVVRLVALVLLKTGVAFARCAGRVNVRCCVLLVLETWPVLALASWATMRVLAGEQDAMMAFTYRGCCMSSVRFLDPAVFYASFRAARRSLWRALSFRFSSGVIAALRLREYAAEGFLEYSWGCFLGAVLSYAGCVDIVP
jgi:hypothetical protein